MKKINFLTTLMVYIFIIVFLKESIESENSILTFMIFVEWSKICNYFKTRNSFYV